MARKRKRFTAQQRTQILAAAKSGGLTAKQVKDKFGVSPVTYYLWRRKAGLTRSHGLAAAARATTLGPSNSGLEKLVRGAVRARIQDALPQIVRDEVQDYLNTLLAKAPGRKTRRKA